MIKMTVSVTINSEWKVWVPKVRPIILLPFRITEAQVKHTDLDKVGVADNFIVLDLDTQSIGGSDLPVGTKKSVVLCAQKLEGWPFLSDDEVVTRIRERKLDKVKAFLGRGIDINAKDTRNRTALHDAAEEGHKKLVELLLAHGADLNASTSYDRTAAELAMSRGHTEIVKLLVSKGADISLLHLAIYLKDVAKARSLIESGADVNKRSPYGTTPLHMAAGSGFKDLANLLIDKGADVNAKDNWNWTPLHSAAEEGHKDLVELLITKGANVNAGDGASRTPLWYAKDEGNTEIVELLRKHGAKE
jgi:ankyrin repeat protein